jgi:hypothetical protein
MTKEIETSQVKFISIIDDRTSDYSLFENLYIPKYETNSSLEELNIKVFNRTTENNDYYYRNGLPTQNTFINPNTTLYNPKRVRSGETDYHLPFLVKQVDVRNYNRLLSYTNPSFVNSIVFSYNFDSLYNYNWDQHQKLINLYNYIPVILDKNHIQQNLPRSINPNMPTFLEEAYNLFNDWFEGIHLVYWKKVSNRFVPESGPLKDKILYSMFSKELFEAFDNNIININDAGELYKVNNFYNLNKLTPQRASNRGYWRNSRNTNKNYDVDSRDLCININVYGDLSFLLNSTIETTSI